MNGLEWNNYIRDLHQYITEQDKRIKELESRLNQMEKQVQDKSKNTIEKIEYHFDQLKIENLDGTLHIGLSPNDLEKSIEEFGIQQSSMPNYQTPAKQALLSSLTDYIQKEGPELIRKLANQYNQPIDEGFLSIMLDDMKKQLPQRIAFYEQEANGDRNINSEEQLKAYISEKIKNEISKSLVKYMQNNEQKGGNQ